MLAKSSRPSIAKRAESSRMVAASATVSDRRALRRPVTVLPVHPGPFANPPAMSPSSSPDHQAASVSRQSSKPRTASAAAMREDDMSEAPGQALHQHQQPQQPHHQNHKRAEGESGSSVQALSQGVQTSYPELFRSQ